MSERVPGESEGGSIDEDLYCLYCTYNLRGLSGDPVRCPECGIPNELEDLRISADVLMKHLKALETLPTVCVAAMWSVAAGAVILVPGGMLCGVVLLAPAPFVWAWAIYRFGSTCNFKPGWVSVLGWYHLAGFLPLLVWAIFGAAIFLLPQDLQTASAMFLLFLFLLAVAVAFRLLGRPRGLESGVLAPYRTAKRKLHVFCWALAVAEAKRAREHES